MIETDDQNTNIDEASNVSYAVPNRRCVPSKFWRKVSCHLLLQPKISPTEAAPVPPKTEEAQSAAASEPLLTKTIALLPAVAMTLAALY